MCECVRPYCLEQHDYCLKVFFCLATLPRSLTREDGIWCVWGGGLSAPTRVPGSPASQAPRWVRGMKQTQRTRRHTALRVPRSLAVCPLPSNAPSSCVGLCAGIQDPASLFPGHQMGVPFPSSRGLSLTLPLTHFSAVLGLTVDIFKQPAATSNDAASPGVGTFHRASPVPPPAAAMCVTHGT